MNGHDHLLASAGPSLGPSPTFAPFRYYPNALPIPANAQSATVSSFSVSYLLLYFFFLNLKFHRTPPNNLLPLRLFSRPIPPILLPPRHFPSTKAFQIPATIINNNNNNNFPNQQQRRP
jgi:hypothetical protein